MLYSAASDCRDAFCCKSPSAHSWEKVHRREECFRKGLIQEGRDKDKPQGGESTQAGPQSQGLDYDRELEGIQFAAS